MNDELNDIEKLIVEARKAQSEGNPKYTDTEYDSLVNTLRLTKPNSNLLAENWEPNDYELGDYDELLKLYPMKSIYTIQQWKELDRFESKLRDNLNIMEKIELLASLKLNGHAFRAVYSFGELVAGSTRGRTKKGRCILKPLKELLPNRIDEWNNIRLIEVRGELLVKLTDFDEIQENYELKTPLSAVTSFIRETANGEEVRYMNCICFRLIYCNDDSVVNKIPTSREEEMEKLMELGFNVPYYRVYRREVGHGVIKTSQEIMEEFSEYMDKNECEYSTDGIVITVNQNKIAEDMGEISGANSLLANFAVKTGKYWGAETYKSVIKDIIYTYGKKYITPKAEIEPTITRNGATVTMVPLYNVGIMDKYGLIPGAEIHFRFGGETGVALTHPDGRLISQN